MNEINDKIENAYISMFEDEQNRLDQLHDEFCNKKEITFDEILYLLRIAVVDEFLAAFNYTISYSKSVSAGKNDVDPEFEAHESEEREHMMKLVNRIKELGAEPFVENLNIYDQFNSCGKCWKQETSTDSIEILKNRWKEELNAIRFYDIILECLKSYESDTTTRKLIEEIKKDEEEHELDLRELINQLS